MLKKEVLIAALFFIAFTFSYAVHAATEAQLAEKLQHQSEIEVYVTFKEPAAHGLSISSTLEDAEGIEIKHRLADKKSFTGKITAQGLKELQKSGLVEKIYLPKPIIPVLDVSVPLINATSVWNLSVGGAAINGSGQTVCVIDTGVDFTHPALGGCTNASFLNGSCSKVVGGYDFANDDANPYPGGSYSSVNHGTHVAGIVASENNTYRGVAPGAKIAALKVFSDSGAANTNNVIEAIDWCVNNASLYNITVITMSIAVVDGSNNEIIYNSSCDSEDTTGLAAEASWAASQGLFVVAAAGNSGSTVGITSPSCGQNVTSVSGTTDADAISGYNTGINLDLLAPGSGIISADKGTGFVSKSGTSMATPHVAGAAALMQQYYRLAHNINVSYSSINSIFNATGKRINDTRNGLAFSRVDVYSAILSIDDTTINIIAPKNISYYNQNFTLQINLSDANTLSAAWYNLTNSSNALIQNNSNYSINAASYSFNNNITDNINISGLNEGNYTLTVSANDSLGNLKQNSSIFIIDKTNPALIIITTHSGTIYNNNTVALSINATDAALNATAILCESNVSGSWSNYTMASSNNITFNYNLTNLTNGWNIAYRFHAVDFAGNVNTSSTYNFTVQNRVPTVNITAPLNSSTLEAGNLTSFASSISDADGDCLTYSWSFGDGTNSSSANATHQYNTTGNYNFTLTVSDGVNNSNLTYLIAVNDTSVPNITLNNPSTSIRLGSNYTVNATITDWSNLSNVNLTYNGTIIEANISGSNYVWIINSSLLNVIGNKNFTINATDTLSHSYLFNYTFNVTSCSDGVKNGDETGTDCGGSCTACVEDTGSSSSSSSSSSSGGGGGGGGGGSTTSTSYVVTDEQLSAGFTESLTLYSKFKFSIDEEEHYVTLDSIGLTEVDITVSSTPQKATLKVGESKKFELSGDDYYDLQVKLNSISDSAASLTIKSINSLIPVKTAESEVEENKLDAGITANISDISESTEAAAETEQNLAGQAAGGSSAANKWILVAILGVIAVISIIYFAIRPKGDKFKGRHR